MSTSSKGPPTGEQNHGTAVACSSTPKRCTGNCCAACSSCGVPQTRLVGITSGGAWLVERLQQDLGLAGSAGVISSAMHRDDFAQRGLAGAGAQTQLPFDVNDAHIMLLDDVLYTGRTIRAVLNELFDYGRPGQRAAGGAGGPRRARAAGAAPISRRRGWHCRPRNRWRWRATRPAYSASRWKGAEKMNPHVCHFVACTALRGGPGLPGAAQRRP